MRRPVADPWVERHRPKRLDQVAGNAQAVADLRRWAESWKTNRPGHRAVLLAGPPGCGKTSAAHALGAELGWELIELNASDARSAPAIQRVAGMGSLHQTFSKTGEFQTTKEGKRKLIVLDEADNLYERAQGDGEEANAEYTDRGGRRAIVETVVNTQQPIVLIANDAYELMRGVGDRMAKSVLRINFRRPAAPTIRKILRDVAALEGVAVSEDVFQAVATGAEGDLRSAINDLEALCLGRTRVDSLGALELGQRNRIETAYDAVATIMKTTEARRAVDAARNLDEPPDFLLAWLDENLPAEYRHPADLVRALHWLGRADVFLGRTRRRQYFGLWAYATELMSAGVAASKSRSYATPPRYQFPGWIRRMGASKGSRGLRDRLAEKVGRQVHMGSRPALREAVPPLASAAARDPAFAVALAMRCELEEDEVRLLLDQADEGYVDDVVARIEVQRAEGSKGQASLAVDEDEPRKGRPSKTAGRRGATLADFSN